MLESVDDLGLAHTVSWQPDGRSFHVKDSSQFADLVLPRFFKATKFRSFQRQLRLWGFQRIRTGMQHCWCHRYFIRGCPEKLSSIIRAQTQPKGKFSSAHNQALTHLVAIPAYNLATATEAEVFESESPSFFSSVRTKKACNAARVSPVPSTSTVSNAITVCTEFNEILKTMSLPEASCTDVMSFPPRSIDVFESNRVAPSYSCKAKAVNNGESWDDMLIDIEPLPLGSTQTQDDNLNQDDFQKFLCQLIEIEPLPENSTNAFGSETQQNSDVDSDDFQQFLDSII